MTTDEKILRAALTLFSEKGYSATTTKMIAQEAGVNEVTIFRHFDNKRSLFDDIIDQLVDTSNIEGLMEDGLKNNPHEDLVNIANSLKELYHTNAPIFKMIFRDNENTHDVKKRLTHKIMPSNEYFEQYFHKMHSIGKISDKPEKSMKFFMFNMIGYLMNTSVMHTHKFDQEYFDWMVEKTISAILPCNN